METSADHPISTRPRRTHATRTRLPGHLLAGVVVLAVLALVGGCKKRTTGTVSGVVTIDGTPVKTGAISFFPTNRKAATAGGEITDGQYSAEVAPGVAKVEIRVPKVVGQKKLYNTPDSPVRPIMAEVLPAKYNDETQLTVDVQLGTNQHDFPLTSH